jgi:hypothetical protein
MSTSQNDAYQYGGGTTLQGVAATPADNYDEVMLPFASHADLNSLLARICSNTSES